MSFMPRACISVDAPPPTRCGRRWTMRFVSPRNMECAPSQCRRLAPASPAFQRTNARASWPARPAIRVASVEWFTRVVLADPGEVLRVDTVVGIQVGDQDLVEVVALLGQNADHPAPAPVHRRGLPDDDPRLEWILDVIEAAQPVPELLLQPGHVLPARLVHLPGDDPDHLLVGRIVGVDDRPDCLL